MYSVVVPTFNRASTLAMALKSLLAQETSVPYEVIVVDNNSRDETKQAVLTLEAKTNGKVRYVCEKDQGASAARNAGIAAAGGTVVAFVDDDVIAHPNWLEALSETYRTRPDAWAVGGKVILRLPEAHPAWFDSRSRILAAYLSLVDHGTNTLKIDYPDALITANLSVRAEALSRVGPFDVDLGPVYSRPINAEDTDLCYRIQRAGGSVYYCGHAVVTHLIPDSRITKRFFRDRAYWDGRSDFLSGPRSCRALLRNLTNDAPTLVKDSVKALAHYGVGDVRRAFEYELAARKRLGHLHHILWPMPRGHAKEKMQEKDLRRGGMRVTILGCTQELDALVGRWNDLVERAGASIFQTMEWQYTWWRCFSSGRILHTLAVWAEDDLVGLMPLFRDSVSIGGLPLVRRFQFVGTGHSDYLDIIAAPGCEERVAESIADHLCALSNWDLIELADVPERSKTIGPLVAALTRRGCTIDRAVHHRCFSIPLPSTWEAYLARLGASTRATLLRKTRRLIEAGFRIEITSVETSVDKAVDDFITLHVRQWESKDQHTVISDPTTQEFHRELARCFHRSGWLKLSSIRLNGQPLATLYEFIYGDKKYYYLGGVVLDSPWAHMSPGAVLMLKSIEQAIDRGLREYDLLRGAESYKVSLRARETLNWRYEIVAPRPSAQAHTILLREMRQLAHAKKVALGRFRRLVSGAKRE